MSSDNTNPAADPSQETSPKEAEQKKGWFNWGLLLTIPKVGLRIAGLLLGYVGLLFGSAYMRGPIEAVCIDRSVEWCSTFEGDFEEKYPTLIERYARRDAGELGNMLTKMLEGAEGAIQIQADMQAFAQLLNQAPDRFDDPAWKAEVSSLTGEINIGLDGLSQNATDQEAVDAVARLKDAVNAVNNSIAAGDRDGFNVGMAQLQAASDAFAAALPALMGG